MTFDELKEIGFVKIPMRCRKFEDGGFKTLSGRIEPYSTRLKAFGYDPLPHYEEPQYDPAMGTYQLRAPLCRIGEVEAVA